MPFGQWPLGAACPYMGARKTGRTPEGPRIDPILHEVLLRDGDCRRGPSQAHGPEPRIIRYQCKADFRRIPNFFDRRILT